MTESNKGNKTAKLAFRIAAALVVGAASLGLYNITRPSAEAANDSQAEKQKLVDDFNAAYRAVVPPMLLKAEPGIFTGVPMETKQGIQICNFSVSEDKTHARTRVIVPSDCRPQ